MDPTETQLRAAADDVRRVADLISEDLTALPTAGGAATWVGPAASTFRSGARSVVSECRETASALRTLARELDHDADIARIEAMSADADGGRGGGAP